MRETISASPRAAGFYQHQGEAVWDRETHWHANHVGDGKVGKWRDALTPAQAEDILNARPRTIAKLLDTPRRQTPVDSTKTGAAVLDRGRLSVT